MPGIPRPFCVLVALALSVPPIAVTAQGPMRLGLGAGVSMPVGDIARTSYAGVNLVAALTYDPPRLPFGMELNASYHGFAPKEKGGENAHVMSVTGGLTIPVAGTLGQPYLFGGVGYYNTQGPATGAADAERDIGGYGGVGLRFRTNKAEFHLKAGFHEIFAGRDAFGRVRSRELIPISFSVVL